jgi:Capsule polysaccharide export protein
MQFEAARPLDRTDLSVPGSVVPGDLVSEDPPRRMLIVTAPFGPFARVLADVFRCRGVEVHRVLLNAGDRLFWRGKGALPYRGTSQDWPAALERMAEGFSDILIFGEAGPYNYAVQSLPRQPGQRLWVLENGYFRPDWVTLEQDGTNASTRLPRDRSAYDGPGDSDAVDQAVEAKRIGRTTPYHVWQISLHHLVQLPGRLAYPHYAPAYTAPAWLQCFGHTRRYLWQLLFGPSPPTAEALRQKGRYALVCLQREGDTQLLRYSRLADNTAFMAEVLQSFARSAPPDLRLVVKNHPLDPGLINLKRIVRSLSTERGVADRVDFIDGGNLAQLCRASEGMVVNNSSAALSALGFGTPVKVLGRAFYDFDGLTDPQPLDAFWQHPIGPDASLFERFRQKVIAEAQINGNFNAPWALRPTANQVADRILGSN